VSECSITSPEVPEHSTELPDSATNADNSMILRRTTERTRVDMLKFKTPISHRLAGARERENEYL
jgi:hypothetical protein